MAQKQILGVPVVMSVATHSRVQTAMMLDRQMQLLNEAGETLHQMEQQVASAGSMAFVREGFQAVAKGLKEARDETSRRQRINIKAAEEGS